MAQLQTTQVNGLLRVNGGMHRSGNSDITEWHRFYHCVCPDTTTGPSDCRGTGLPFLHVRTPIPADVDGIGWNPIILEVKGFHSYSGEYTHDWKALLNINGYNNAWFGSQIMNNNGAGSAGGSEPYVYRSTNTYGGRQRVCFSMRKISCCCVGWYWVRWYNRSDHRNSFPWGQFFGQRTDQVF